LKSLVYATLVALLLAGCASEPKREAGPARKPERVEQPASPALPGGAAAVPVPVPVQVDPVTAATEYLQRAENALAPERQDLQLKAAASLIRAGRVRQAEELLDSIDITELPDIYRARQRVLRAAVDLYYQHGRDALNKLTPLFSMQGLGPEVQSDVYQLRAQANLMLGNKLDSVLDLIAREAFLASSERIAQNQAHIWRVLGSMSAIELQDTRQKSADSGLNGWLDLAMLNLEFGADPFVFRQALAQWQQTYGGQSAHEFAKSFLGAGQIEPLQVVPRRIALLLPLASQFGQAAQAVHDGFLAVHQNNSDPAKPEVQVYDVGAEPGLSVVYYNLAVKDGADFVVGPLGRNAVNALAASGAISRPTILLGTIDSNQPVDATVYQFDLAPEQEAEQAAQRAYLDGHRIAAILYPGTSWGERLQKAFTARWESLGGIVAEQQAYAEDATDFSHPIKQVLNVYESEARKADVARLTGLKLEFEPRRRQDIDCIFLAAQVRAARLIKPQINFYRGFDIPVYSTSHVFTGKVDPVNDADLNGIYFGDMPWLLNEYGRIPAMKERIQKDWPGRQTALDRLYALGADAYSLVFRLPWLRAGSDARLSGATASLSLDHGNRITRNLTWARFEKGRPVIKDVIIDDQALESISLESRENPAPVSRRTGGT